MILGSYVLVFCSNPCVCTRDTIAQPRSRPRAAFDDAAGVPGASDNSSEVVPTGRQGHFPGPPNGLSSPVTGLPADSPQGQVRPQRGQRYLSPAAPRDGAASLRSPACCPVRWQRHSKSHCQTHRAVSLWYHFSILRHPRIGFSESDKLRVFRGRIDHDQLRGMRFWPSDLQTRFGCSLTV